MRRKLNVVLVLAMLALMCFGAQAAFATYWDDAQNTHNFVVGNLLTPYDSYYVDTGNQGATYEWFDASQIYADATMVRRGDSRYLPYMNNTYYNFMYLLWHNVSPGGYYAGSAPDGSGVYTPQKYVDDNALTGNAYMDCYEVTTGTDQANYLASAQAVANWLMYCNLWDTTYGGGFWWNTDTTLKPTQSNALAMRLFIRLYRYTGQSYYKSWADSIKSWLEGTMKDTSDGLFCWKYDGGGRNTTKFTYDNSIMIEAYLDYWDATGTASYKTTASTLADKMKTKLWNNTYGVYRSNSSAGGNIVNPVYCVWASCALVKLYQATGTTSRLDNAQTNINYMNTYLRDGTNLGYYSQCNVNGTGRTTTQQGVDQAWMQRALAMLSQYR